MTFEQRFNPPPGLESYQLSRWNPGGLADVYSEEHMRDALFYAIRHH